MGTWGLYFQVPATGQIENPGPTPGQTVRLSCLLGGPILYICIVCIFPLMYLHPDQSEMGIE